MITTNYFPLLGIVKSLIVILLGNFCFQFFAVNCNENNSWKNFLGICVQRRQVFSNSMNISFDTGLQVTLVLIVWK